ncbi:MAG: prolipoprotein diacylglyceryl transferase [Gemmatimonadota bacterium]|nr:MAG: prolipoprotein diacylglyceryl transferase [Gemmatimonadota bacterium]
MYPILFRLKGIEFTSFGLMLGLAFLAAGWVTSVELQRKGHSKDAAWSLILGALVGGIVGAKLYYAFLNWPLLVRDPLPTLFSRAGLVWYGGFLGGCLGVIIMARRERLPVGQVADAAALALPAAYAVGRVGCFLVGDDYGRPTDSWIGMAFPRGAPPSTAGSLRGSFGLEIPEAIPDWEVLRVHPTQLYEIALSLLILVFLWRLRKHSRKAGWLFWLYLILAGCERAFVELFRAKDDRFFGTFTLAQTISVALVIVGAIGVWSFSRQRAARREPASSA